jgi:hypothetical protein
MVVRFCTLFDSRYASRGLVMLESLTAYSRPGDAILVLCLDKGARRLVESAGAGRWQAIDIADLGDQDLLALKLHRPHREFCWTCTPALTNWLVHRSKDGDIAVYLDADLMFFDDPRILLEELKDGGSVLIHEHRYSPDRMWFQPESGRFNVGFVAFDVGPEARRCAAKWRQQTIACCEVDPERGLCGDQGYLNSWPADFPNVRVMRNIGGGVAPWNVNQYAVTSNPVAVDAVPVVFFHYHAFQFIMTAKFGVVLVEPAHAYAFSRETIKTFYRPYIARLTKAARKAARLGLPFEPDRKLSWRELAYGFRRNWFLPAFIKSGVL